MKTIKNLIGSLALILIITLNINAQKKTLTVLNVDCQGISKTPEQLGNMLRMEIEKLDTFEVMDRYDVAYMIKKHDLDIEHCYGKICLLEVGKIIQSDMMLSGSIELYNKTLYLTVRMVDVEKGKIEKILVKEFLGLHTEIQTMMKLTVREMLDLPIDELEMGRLTKIEQFENKTINPYVDRLNLSGPRLGVTYFTGEIANHLHAQKHEGGFETSIPLMFMFGYQFELQYLNSGNFQALFEFVPTITGVDQGMIMPNLSILMGFRHNVKGWEIALGPTAGLIKKASGYYVDGVWNLKNDWESEDPIPYNIEKRIDSRGEVAFHTGFIIAAGKSFKSGKMNYPVNVFVIPSKAGVRFGLTVGFNAKN